MDSESWLKSAHREESRHLDKGIEDETFLESSSMKQHLGE